MDVETGVEVDVGACVIAGAGVEVEEGLTGASEPQADEIRIRNNIVTVTFDCLLMAPGSFRVPQRGVDHIRAHLFLLIL